MSKITPSIIKGWFTIHLYHYVVNSLVLIQVLLLRKKTSKPKSELDCTVWIIINRAHFFISIISLWSLDSFIPGLHYVIADDGSFRHYHRWLIKKLGPNVDYQKIIKRPSAKNKFRQYPYLEKFFRYGWSGLKFYTPIYESMGSKIILLDSDTLFFDLPRQIIRWLKSDRHPLFLKDYLNFSVISTLEFKAIDHRPVTIHNVNSGLLCLDLDLYRRKNPLKVVNAQIKKILATVKDRMTYDHFSSNDLIYVFPLIEQTLHWLGLNRCHAQPLDDSYLVFPKHKTSGQPITDPTFIHFTGDSFDKRVMYKYLFYSLISYLYDRFFHKLNSLKPWYIYSQNYCPQCQHSNK